MRFVSDPVTGTRLEAAIAVYADAQGRRVDFAAAIHIGDQEYYDTLDQLFLGYDAVLYEMVKDPDASPVVDEDAPVSAISQFQRLLKNVLDLEFQLDAVDYSAANFVHADLDPDTFFELQAERGESLFTLMLQAAAAETLRQNNDPSQAAAQQLSMVLALLSKDRPTALKSVLGRQFGDLQAMAAGLQGGDEGSVLLHGRNARAFEVLAEQLDLGHDKLAVFYGAAHLEDMERRLLAMGFERLRTIWLTAWDIE